MKNSKMGLGGSGPATDGMKKSTSPISHAKAANVTARNGIAKKTMQSDALANCGKNSPVKCKGK